MPVYAQLFDGSLLEFADDTPHEVINRVAREQTQRIRINSNPILSGPAPRTIAEARARDNVRTPAEQAERQRLEEQAGLRVTPTGVLDEVGQRLKRGFSNYATGVNEALAPVGDMWGPGGGDMFRQNAEFWRPAAGRKITGEVGFGEVIDNPTVSNIAKATAGGAVESIPSMVNIGSGVGLVAEGASRSGNIAHDRAQADGRDDASLADLAIASPAGAASALLDRFGAEFMFGKFGTTAASQSIMAVLSKTAAGRMAIDLAQKGAASLAGRTAGAMAGEGATEGAQGFIEYAGGSVGTKKGFDPAEAARQTAENALGGVAIGGAFHLGHEGLEATAHGASRIREGVRQKAAAVPLTPADQASPIPTDLIAEGKATLADAGAAPQADSILQKAGMPATGKRVQITMPDGRTQVGTVADAFTTALPGVGEAPGVNISLDDGQTLSEHIDTLRDAGVQIEELSPLAEADAIDAQLAAAAKPDTAPPAVHEGHGSSHAEATVSDMVGITEQTESGGRRYGKGGGLTTSPKGARGEMQVMPGTQTDPGFGVRPAADNSPDELARVGRDYLGAMMRRYGGDPAKAWAAYNAGPGALDAAVKAHGDGWLDHMPAETQAYVAKNMKELAATPNTSPSADLTPSEATQPAASAKTDEPLSRAFTQQDHGGDLAGEPIDAEWTRFHRDSGTLDIPRSEMPQVRAEHRGAMVNFLAARGIAHEEETVPARSLKPTQAEFSSSKVAKAKDFEGGNRAILISADHHIADGHHQWIAARDKGEDVRAIRLAAPIRDLLPAMHEFPSSTVDEGANQSAQGNQQLPSASVAQADVSTPTVEDTGTGKSIIVKGASAKQLAAIKAALPKQVTAVENKKLGGWVWSKKHEGAIRQALKSDADAEARRSLRRPVDGTAPKSLDDAYAVMRAMVAGPRIDEYDSSRNHASHVLSILEERGQSEASRLAAMTLSTDQRLNANEQRAFEIIRDATPGTGQPAKDEHPGLRIHNLRTGDEKVIQPRGTVPPKDRGPVTQMPGKATLKQNEVQGWNAYLAGFELADDPYLSTSSASDAWRKGWRSGEANPNDRADRKRRAGVRPGEAITTTGTGARPERPTGPRVFVNHVGADGLTADERLNQNTAGPQDGETAPPVKAPKAEAPTPSATDSAGSAAGAVTPRQKAVSFFQSNPLAAEALQAEYPGEVQTTVRAMRFAEGWYQHQQGTERAAMRAAPLARGWDAAEAAYPKATKHAKPKQSIPDYEPVAVLSGDEIKGETIAELRDAAKAWYRANLVGKNGITTADGRTVSFSGKGLRESTSGGHGPDILKGFPAIRAIVEKGVLVESRAAREPGYKAMHIYGAIVELAGVQRTMGVFIREAHDGNFHYDFTILRSLGTEGQLSLTDGGREASPDPKSPSVINIIDLESDEFNNDPNGGGFDLERDWEMFADDPDAQAWLRVKDGLSQQLAALGLTDKVKLTIVDSIHSGAAGEYLDQVIRIALDANDMAFTLDHEAVHALRDMGLFREAEWKALEREARADTAMMASIRERYGDKGLTEDEVVEEAIADRYARWAKNPPAEKGLIARAFERIRDVVGTIGRVLRGEGFTSAEQVMRAIRSGEVGARDATPTTTGRAKASIPPSATFDSEDANDTPPSPGAQLVSEVRDRALDRAIDRSFNPHADRSPNVSAVVKLRQLFRRFEDGKITRDGFVAGASHLWRKLENRSAERRMNVPEDRERGADFIREKLLQAKRRGDIDEATADFAEWFVQQNPSLLDNLGISVRAARNEQARSAGAYNPASRVMFLFKGRAATGTAVHEMLHHLERMMPVEMQDAIRDEWMGGISRLADGTQQQRVFAEAAMVAAANPTRDNIERVIRLLPNREAYQFVNPSEFWAENATRLLSARYAAQDGIWSRIRQWLGEMVQHARNVLRLSSDAPMIRAINHLVSEGDGSFRRGNQMLARASIFADERDGPAVDLSENARQSRAIQQGFLTEDTWQEMKNGQRGAGEDRQYDDAGRDQGDRRTNAGEAGDRSGNGAPVGKGRPVADAGSSGLATFHHGTRDQIGAFTIGHPNRKDNGWLGRGIYLTDDPRLAKLYAANKRGDGNPHVMDLHVRLKNPYIASLETKKALRFASETAISEWTDARIAEGHDGTILTYPDGTAEIAIFDPVNLRAAGAAFDPEHDGEAGLLYSLSESGPWSIFGRESSNSPGQDIEQRATDLVSALSAGPPSSRSGGSPFDRWRTALQDRMLPLLRTQQAVERMTGEPLDEAQNPYLGEELMTGRLGARVEQLADEMVGPLFEAMHIEGITLEELETYLYARHAPERNAHIASINPEFGQGEGSGMTDAEAAAIMDAVRDSGKQEAVDRLARQIGAINDLALAARVESGLLSRGEALAWKKTYQYYVPLRGTGDIDGGGNARPSRQSGISVRGKESKRAFGRKSRASDIVAYTVMQAEDALRRSETNRVARQFLALAQANPDPDFWTIDKTNRRAYFDDAAGRVRYQNVTAVSADDAPFTISAKVDGQEHRVTMNRDNPGAVRVADAMRNLSAQQVNQFAQFLGVFTRFFSRINTVMNPEFVVTNALRDIQTSAVTLNQYGERGLAASVVSDWRKALFAGKNTGGEWSSWRKEFEAAGGKMYYSDLGDLEAQRKRIEKLASRGNPAGIRVAATKAVNLVNDINDRVENAIRLSTYANLRRRGATEAQAASAARNVTVNFTRRGTQGPLINSLYAFFNAGVQGSATLITAAARSRNVRRALLGFILLGFLTDMLNRLVSDDDDDGESFWAKVPDYDKEKNFIVMLPGGGDTSVKLPLGLGLNAFFSLGRNLSEMLHGRSPLEAGGETMATIADAFNPLGSGSLLTTVLPTVLDPVAELATNRNFAGKPIQPDPKPFGEETPASERYFASVSTASRKVAEWLNSASGGDAVVPGKISISPEVLDYLAAYATGGLGRFVGTIENLALAPFDADRQISTADIPFVRKVVGEKPEWLDKSLFYDRMNTVEQTALHAKTYEDGGNLDRMSAYIEQNRSILAMSNDQKQAGKAMREVRKLKGQLEQAREHGDVDDDRYVNELDTLKDREASIVSLFNKRWNEAIQTKE